MLAPPWAPWPPWPNAEGRLTTRAIVDPATELAAVTYRATSAMPSESTASSSCVRIAATRRRASGCQHGDEREGERSVLYAFAPHFGQNLSAWRSLAAHS